MAFLESSETVNYSETARDFKVDRVTLRRRFLSISTSKKEAAIHCSGKLSPEQENTLVQHIIKLTNRGTPPSPHIIKNFAEEMIQGSIGQQWTTRFIRRHESDLKSTYLHPIDHARQRAEYKPHFIKFYRLVSSNWAYNDSFIYFFN